MASELIEPHNTRQASLSVFASTEPRLSQCPENHGSETRLKRSWRSVLIRMAYQPRARLCGLVGVGFTAEKVVSIGFVPSIRLLAPYSGSS